MLFGWSFFSRLPNIQLSRFTKACDLIAGPRIIQGVAQPAAKILIADDQSDVVEALRLLLKSEGYRTETVNSPSGVLEALTAREFDLLMMDLNYTRDTTSGAEGLELLARVQRLDPTLPVVVMTAWASVELAVEAMRCGARDFIQKPWE